MMEQQTQLKTGDEEYGNADYLDDLSDEEYIDFVVAFLKPTPIEWGFVVIFLFLMIIGVIGNLLVVYVVFRNKSMWSPMNIFLCNLAFSDLLVLMFCLPPTVLNDITKTFWLSAGFCKAMVFFQNTSVYVSVITLMCISVERWRAISQPLSTRLWNTHRIIIIIWTVAAILSLPEPFTLEVQAAEYARKNISTIWGTRCKESWSAEFQQKYQLTQTVFLFIVPLFIITTLCIHMSLILHRKSLQIGKRHLKERQKAIRILVAVVIIFTIAYLPVHIHNIANAFELEPEGEPSLIAVAFRKFIPRIMSYSSSVVNPIAYNFMSERFRKEFHRACHCMAASEGRSDSHRDRFYSLGRYRPSMATSYSPTPSIARTPVIKKTTLASMDIHLTGSRNQWFMEEPPRIRVVLSDYETGNGKGNKRASCEGSSFESAK